MFEGRPPGPDSLHVGLALALTVLTIALLGGHEFLLRHSYAEWRSLTEKSLRDYEAADVEILEATEGQEDVPSAEAEEARARAKEAQRVFSRDTLRAADRMREMKYLVSLRGYLWGAVAFAAALAFLGWRRRRRLLRRQDSRQASLS
jgi:hypothetical protein